jgi:hypothetical protein
MEETSILTEVLRETFKIPAEQTAALLHTKAEDSDEPLPNPDAAKLIAAEIKKRVSELAEKKFGEGANKVSKKYKTALQTVFGLEEVGDLQDEELVALAFQKAKMPDPEAAKKADDFKQKEAELKAEFQKIKQGLEEQLLKKEAELLRLKQSARKQAIALSYLDGYNPVIDDDEEVAETRRSNYLSDIERFGIEEEGGKEFATLNGERVEDGAFNQLTIQEVIAQRTRAHFKQAAQSAKGSAGNVTQSPANGAIPKKFKDEYEVILAMNNEKDLERKKAIFEAWEKQQAAAAT